MRELDLWIEGYMVKLDPRDEALGRIRNAMRVGALMMRERCADRLIEVAEADPELAASGRVMALIVRECGDRAVEEKAP